MKLSELFDQNQGAVMDIGIQAVSDARKDGVPAYYMDPALGAGIIRELPDGMRERIERRGGSHVVIERYGPRS